MFASRARNHLRREIYPYSFRWFQRREQISVAASHFQDPLTGRNQKLIYLGKSAMVVVTGFPARVAIPVSNALIAVKRRLLLRRAERFHARAGSEVLLHCCSPNPHRALPPSSSLLTSDLIHRAVQSRAALEQVMPGGFQLDRPLQDSRNFTDSIA